MNRTCMRTTILWVLAAVCTLLLSITVWADEPSAPSIVVSGAAAAREEEDSLLRQGETGPGVVSSIDKETEKTDKRGESLGIFTITGYCPGECCGGGCGLTYSGTVPKANYTLSADLERFPIGTKLMIGGTIYTVEDMGSSVRGDCVDIFYDTHEEALARGTFQEEIFTVVEE